MHFFIVLRNRDYVIIPPLLSLLTLDKLLVLSTGYIQISYSWRQQLIKLAINERKI